MISDEYLLSANVLHTVELTDVSEPNNLYFWTDKERGSYHSNRNCPIIKSRNNIESGSLETAYKKKNLTLVIFVLFSKKSLALTTNTKDGFRI